jgi:hypothetical protein
VVTSWFAGDVCIATTKVIYCMGNAVPLRLALPYTCDRLTFVSGCIVEATNEDIAAMGFTIGFQEAG